MPVHPQKLFIQHHQMNALHNACAHMIDKMNIANPSKSSGLCVLNVVDNDEKYNDRILVYPHHPDQQFITHGIVDMRNTVIFVVHTRKTNFMLIYQYRCFETSKTDHDDIESTNNPKKCPFVTTKTQIDVRLNNVIDISIHTVKFS